MMDFFVYFLVFIFFFFFFLFFCFFFFFQAEDGIRDRSPSRGLGDVYKRQVLPIRRPSGTVSRCCARCIRPVAPAVWIAQARDWFDPCLRTARSLARSPGTGTSSMPRTLSSDASPRLPPPCCVASTSPRSRRTSTLATSSSSLMRRRSP